MPVLRGAVGKYLLKWLVVPLLLAAIGFYLVGPRIGTPSSPPAISTDPSKGLTPSGDTGDAPKYKEPDVEVTSRPANRRSRRSTRRNTTSRATVVRQEQVPSRDEEPPF